MGRQGRGAPKDGGSRSLNFPNPDLVEVRRVGRSGMRVLCFVRVLCMCCACVCACFVCFVCVLCVCVECVLSVC